jgi:hypothetical protein
MMAHLPYDTTPERVRLRWDAFVIACADLVRAERERGRSVWRDSVEQVEHERALNAYQRELRAAGYRWRNLRTPHLVRDGVGLSAQIERLL